MFIVNSRDSSLDSTGRTRILQSSIIQNDFDNGL